MCGRFALFDEKKFDIEEGFNFKPNYNVSPGSMAVSYTHLTLPTTPYV